jgi:urease subunit gamma/beta
MHLTPREQERLLLSSGADLARRRLARGARLGAAEAVALVCDEICEMAWDDFPLEEVVERARTVVPPESLVPGVAAAVPSVQVEALFPHGTVLVHVAAPFGLAEADSPGAVRTRASAVELAPGRRHGVATLHNTGAQPIWVSSHFPLGALNPALEVSLPDAAAYRLDVPAGVAVRIDAGERKEVGVVGIEVTAR